MNIFEPNKILQSYKDFDIDDFRKRGYKTILLDVDNTITPYYQKTPDEEARAFVKRLKDAGFEVIVYSNNTNKRVSSTAKTIECEYVCWAFKPLPFKCWSLLKKKGFDKKTTLCMGDQLITDVLCGKLAGIYAIYVKPISEVDSFNTSVNRFFERLIFKYVLHEKV
ncbi:MAG: YqeG family HAD IIIA-type phosphatase [Erysipelotrichaceae bacterium]|nr:YqeG family HAD IIIA-type phosphatase [Erysipelotrichaceae bacterium]